MLYTIHCDVAIEIGDNITIPYQNKLDIRDNNYMYYYTLPKEALQSSTSNYICHDWQYSKATRCRSAQSKIVKMLCLIGMSVDKARLSNCWGNDH